jgi:hypothetical protein
VPKSGDGRSNACDNWIALEVDRHFVIVECCCTSMVAEGSDRKKRRDGQVGKNESFACLGW